MKADCLLVPMVPNLLPSRGVGFQILHDGGPALVHDFYKEAKRKLHLKRIHSAHIKKENKNNQTTSRALSSFPINKNAITFDIGDIIMTSPHGLENSFNIIAFLILPFYWQHNSAESAQRLRQAVASGLAVLNEMAVSSLCLPHIGKGLFGYSPSFASHILLEEAVECILQVGASRPIYYLKHIHFVDKQAETIEELSKGLQEMASLYLPEEKLLDSYTYLKNSTRCLVELTEKEIESCCRRKKITFQKYHGIMKNRQRFLKSNMSRFLWRSKKCDEPPPFLLHQNSGSIADIGKQLKPSFSYSHGQPQSLDLPQYNSNELLFWKHTNYE